MAAISVLLAANGAPWEAAALGSLRPPGSVVLKRCVDLPDLLATASTGQADVAVVDAGLPGLDSDAVSRLEKYDVRVVGVGGADLAKLGIGYRVGREDLATLPVAVSLAARTRGPEAAEDDQGGPAAPKTGRIIAVWGPRGAPGRTTVAVSLAALRAATGQRRVVLADLDSFGGAVAQHLGILDEASGLLAAARLVNTGALDPASFALTRRSVGDGFEVLTGLPRADRWIEVRPGAVEAMVELAAAHADVVLDVGFCLESDVESLGPQRHHLTSAALGCADEIVVVGTGDAVGLSRLARALVEVQEVVPGVPLRVVINRFRDSMGWSLADIESTLRGFAGSPRVHPLTEDVPACDQAMLAGVPIATNDQGRLAADLHALASACFPDEVEARKTWGRRRR